MNRHEVSQGVIVVTGAGLGSEQYYSADELPEQEQHPFYPLETEDSARSGSRSVAQKALQFTGLVQR